MKRMIMYGAIGVVCGLGAGTAGTVIGARKHAAAATADSAKGFVDSTKASHDSAKVAAHAPTDTAIVGDSAAAVVVDAGVSDTAHPLAATAASKSKGAGVTNATPTSPAAAASSADSSGAPGVMRAVLPPPAVRDDSGPVRLARLGKLFAAMSPRDAAKVLTQLSDTDVHEILGKLSDRQAATILAAFPADRAAAITKLALRRGVGGAQ